MHGFFVFFLFLFFISLFSDADLGSRSCRRRCSRFRCREQSGRPASAPSCHPPTAAPQCRPPPSEGCFRWDWGKKRKINKKIKREEKRRNTKDEKTEKIKGTILVSLFLSRFLFPFSSFFLFFQFFSFFLFFFKKKTWRGKQEVMGA
jgi:hypothetical protein